MTVVLICSAIVLVSLFVLPTAFAWWQAAVGALLLVVMVLSGERGRKYRYLRIKAERRLMATSIKHGI
ncbi:hypothetical protein D3C80_1626490 [compost metagenome]